MSPVLPDVLVGSMSEVATGRPDGLFKPHGKRLHRKQVLLRLFVLLIGGYLELLSFLMLLVKLRVDAFIEFLLDTFVAPATARSC